MCKKTAFLLLFTVLFISAAFPRSYGEVESVKKEIIETLEAQAESEKRFSRFLESLSVMLQDRKELLGIVILSLKIAAVMLLVIVPAVILIRFLLLKGVRQTSEEKQRVYRDADLIVFNEEVWKGLIASGNLREAALYLHRCAFYMLIKEKELYYRNLTNRTLSRFLSNPERRDLFLELSVVSERILFDNYTPDEKTVKIQKNIWDNFTGAVVE